MKRKTFDNQDNNNNCLKKFKKENENETNENFFEQEMLPNLVRIGFLDWFQNPRDISNLCLVSKNVKNAIYINEKEFYAPIQKKFVKKIISEFLFYFHHQYVSTSSVMGLRFYPWFKEQFGFDLHKNPEHVNDFIEDHLQHKSEFYNHQAIQKLITENVRNENLKQQQLEEIETMREKRKVYLDKPSVINSNSCMESDIELFCDHKNYATCPYVYHFEISDAFEKKMYEKHNVEEWVEIAKNVEFYVLFRKKLFFMYNLFGNVESDDDFIYDQNADLSKILDNCNEFLRTCFSTLDLKTIDRPSVKFFLENKFVLQDARKYINRIGTLLKYFPEYSISSDYKFYSPVYVPKKTFQTKDDPCVDFVPPYEQIQTNFSKIFQICFDIFDEE